MDYYPWHLFLIYLVFMYASLYWIQTEKITEIVYVKIAVKIQLPCVLYLLGSLLLANCLRRIILFKYEVYRTHHLLGDPGFRRKLGMSASCV